MQIHSAVGLHPSGRDVLTEALGHKAGSGSGQVKIGALSHFGLVKPRRGGAYEISDLAQRILHPSDDREKRAAVAEAARTPALYAELVAQFNGQQVPSLLGNLLARNYGVIPKQAEAYAERFRTTMEFAGLMRNGVLHAGLPDAPDSAEQLRDDESLESEVKISGSDNAAVHARQPRTMELRAPCRDGLLAETQEYTIPLGRDGALAVIRLPVPVRDAHLKRVVSWAGSMQEILENESEMDNGAERVGNDQ